MTVEADLFSSVAQPLDVGALDRRAGARDDVPGLDALRASGVLRDVDVHFARTVARLAGVHDPLVLLGLAVASRAPGAGHVCAELDAPERLVRMERAEAPTQWPDAAAWCEALAGSAVVASAPLAAAGTTCPLVLDGHRLYLARYWGYQRRLLEALRARAGVLRADVDEALLRDGLARLFPARDDGAPDLQRTAAAAAVLRALAVITGGPGTASTVVVLPVPGPPVTTASARSTAAAAAVRCQSGAAPSDAGKSRASPSRSTASSTSPRSVPARARSASRRRRW